MNVEKSRQRETIKMTNREKELEQRVKKFDRLIVELFTSIGISMITTMIMYVLLHKAF